VEFDPQVLRSISEHRRRVRIDQGLVLLPVALALICLVLLMVLERKVAIIGGIAIAATAIILTILVCNLNKRYRRFTTPASKYRNVSGDLFKEQLEAVSIGAGIPFPDLVVLDLPTVNAVAFLKDGEPAVGVTSKAVSRPFSRLEAEAIMAHEVAHITIGDILRPLDAWSLRLIAFEALLSLALTALVTFLLSLIFGLDIHPAVFFVSVVTIFWVGTIFGFVFRRFDFASRHDDILADSIAAKLTEDPSALKTAIQEVDRSVSRARKLPDNDHCSRHLFICPHHFKKIPRSRLSLRDDLVVMGLSTEDSEMQLRRAAETIPKRLINLDAIEQGHWPAFDG